MPTCIVGCDEHFVVCGVIDFRSEYLSSWRATFICGIAAPYTRALWKRSARDFGEQQAEYAFQGRGRDGHDAKKRYAAAYLN